MGYGIVIKKIRNNMNLSLRAFGKLVGVGFSHLSLLEREGSYIGKESTSPAIDTLKQICDRAEYPFRQFLEEAGYIEPVELQEPSDLQKIYDKLDDSGKEILMNTANILLNQIGETIQTPDTARQKTNIVKN